MSTKTKIHITIGQEAYTSRMSMRGHLLVADEPIEKGGKDKGPTPTELILSGLGSCTAATLRMYADRKGWEVDRINIEVEIRIEKTDAGQTAFITNHVDIIGHLNEDQKLRMLEIARKCPVHKLLTNQIEIDVKKET